MSTTRSDLSAWFDEGVEQGASHMIVVCDTFDHEDYPVFIMPGADARSYAAEQFGWPDIKNMQRVMEVYDLRKNKDSQLSEHRAFHW